MLGKVFVFLLLSMPKGTDKGVKFTYFAPNATSVYLIGDFNNWNTNATMMKKNADGLWSVIVPLTPGKYQYKFFVDGKYEADPTNPITEGPYGNSVIRIGPNYKVLPPEMSNNTPMNSYVTFSGRAKGFLSIDRDSTNRYRLFTTESDVRMGINVNIKEEATLLAILHYNTETGQDPSTHQIPFYFERAKLNFDKGNLHFVSFYNKFAYQSPDPMNLVGKVNEFGYPFGRDEEGVLMKIERPSTYSIQALYSNQLSTGRDLGFLRLERDFSDVYSAFSIYLTHGTNIEYQVISPDSETVNDSTLLHFNTYEDRLIFGFEAGKKNVLTYELLMGKDIKRANYYDVDGSKTQQAPIDKKWMMGNILKFRSIYGYNNHNVYLDLEHHEFDSLFTGTFGLAYSNLRMGGKINNKYMDIELYQNFLIAGSMSTKWDALFKNLEINRTKYIEYPLFGYSHYTFFHFGTHYTLLKRLKINLKYNTARYALNQPPRTDEVLFNFNLPLGRFGTYYDLRYFHIKSGYLNTDSDFFDNYVELYYRPSENLKVKAGYGFYPYNLLDEHTYRREYLHDLGLGVSQLESNFKGLGGFVEESEHKIAENREIRLWLELSF